MTIGDNIDHQKEDHERGNWSVEEQGGEFPVQNDVEYWYEHVSPGLPPEKQALMRCMRCKSVVLAMDRWEHRQYHNEIDAKLAHPVYHITYNGDSAGDLSWSLPNHNRPVYLTETQKPDGIQVNDG